MTIMLGTLRNEGEALVPALVAGRLLSERNERLPSPVGVSGINPPCFLFLNERAVDGRLSVDGEAALELRERPLGSGGASAGVGREAERMAGGETASVLSKGMRIGRDSDRAGEMEASSTIIPA